MIVQFRICLIDGKPPPESEAYKTLVEECGTKIANRWTKIVKVDLCSKR